MNVGFRILGSALEIILRAGHNNVKEFHITL